MSGPSRPPRRFLDAKGWLALGGLAFGVVQLVVTIFMQQRGSRLQQALLEEAKFRLTADFLYLNSEAFGNLLRRVERGDQGTAASPATLRVSVVQVAADTPWTDDRRPAGWGAFQEIHARSLQDPGGSRDQVYRFLRLINRGEDDVEELHVLFTTGDSAVIHGVAGGNAVLIPVGVDGRHSNLARLRARDPQRAWYLYRFLGKTKAVEISLRRSAELRSTDLPGAWQALPEFGRND